MSRRDVDECGAHREGLGRCWPKSSVKGERLLSMTLEELGSTSGILCWCSQAAAVSDGLTVWRDARWGSQRVPNEQTRIRADI